jgi:hypothetical protein
MKIELIVTDEGIFVSVDGEFADQLGHDEALGVVAAALFSGRRIPYVRSYESWTRWNERYGTHRLEPVQALIEDRRVISTAHTGLRPLHRS